MPVGTLTAVQLLTELITLVANGAEAMQKVSDVIRQANAENRDVTLDELKQLEFKDAAARAALEAAIIAAGE